MLTLPIDRIVRSALLAFLAFTPILANAAPALQKPITDHSVEQYGRSRPLYGRFLHITDIHPDLFYKAYSSVGKECHRGSGSAGPFGAEKESCDSPLSLLNATFDWISDNLKNSIDFVVWTGDNARHDNDEVIPRTREQILEHNIITSNKIIETFGKGKGHRASKDLAIPVIPTFGNNDIFPHNVLRKGPNQWTVKFADIWKKFIPEEQIHTFQQGGWFHVEVIPDKLAVFSLNTLYLFAQNSEADGCSKKFEPGYELMEWLRIQLQIMRDRGLKVILMGHVPPARTGSKRGWDESCWQKYTLWTHLYRDVIIGSMYGHMNIDHFALQDFEDVDLLESNEHDFDERTPLEDEDEEMSIFGKTGYLTELRKQWGKLPIPPSEGSWNDLFDVINEDMGRRYSKKNKLKKYYKKIGGRWGERYSLSLISPSVVPNFFPTLRVIEYNISGLDSSLPTIDYQSSTVSMQDDSDHSLLTNAGSYFEDEYRILEEKEEKKKKAKTPHFTVPLPPSKSSPPGPAYSPQTFTWLSYTQYFANLTHINGDYSDTTKLRKSGKKRPPLHTFRFEVEYNTANDSTYRMEDLTISSYLDLARRISSKSPPQEDRLPVTNTAEEIGDAQNGNTDESLDFNFARKRKKHKNKKGRKAINKVWFEFVKRAYVLSRDDDELHDIFGQR